MVALAWACSLGVWICSILVGVKAIQRKETVVGVICCIPFCTIVGLIYGWIKAKEWAITNLMLAFTLLFVVAIILNVMSRPATL